MASMEEVDMVEFEGYVSQVISSGRYSISDAIELLEEMKESLDEWIEALKEG